MSELQRLRYLALLWSKGQGQFRAYFQALKDLGIFTTTQEAVDALDKEQRELDRKRSAISGGHNG